MTEALEDWQLAPQRIMDLRVQEGSISKIFSVEQDSVALEHMLRRILQNIAAKHYGFDQTEIEQIQKSSHMISLGDSQNGKVQHLAQELQGLTPAGVNEPLFMPYYWKVGQDQAMVCHYRENPRRLCDAVNALVDRLSMQDVAQKIIYDEMEALENSRYQGRG
jgi:hypothetical protein